MGYSMKLIDSYSGEIVMKLSYKAQLNDLIRNDDTREFYVVTSIDDKKRECKARRDYKADKQFN